MIAAVGIVKRVVDVIGSLVGIGLTLPLYAPIAIAVYLDSPGPVLFTQRRAGRLLGTDRNHRPQWSEFTLFKFRTMQLDAERVTGAVIAGKSDPRITRVGRFLRASRLDEILQFWNVLRGDMSIVGPRPERPELLESLAAAIPYFEERCRGVKPGITGLSQVSLGYTGAAPEGTEVARLLGTLTNPYQISEAQGALADDMRIKLMFDLAYAASLDHLGSFLRMELWIIVMTPIVMVLRRGN